VLLEEGLIRKSQKMPQKKKKKVLLVKETQAML